MRYIITQKLLAKKVDCTPNHLSSILAYRENCSPMLAAKLSKFTNISTDRWLPENMKHPEKRTQVKQELKTFLQNQREKYEEYLLNI
jgi:plasmid maintenance system antidote protein VapI